MSTLWTPSGEHEPETHDHIERGRDPGSGEPMTADTPGEATSDDARAAAEELRRIRAEIAATPAIDLIANHAVGLWQLALLHLVPEEGNAPRPDQAALAIDALGGIVDGLGARLGPHADALRDALSQLRLAYVQVLDREHPDGEVPPESGDEQDTPDDEQAAPGD